MRKTITVLMSAAALALPAVSGAAAVTHSGGKATPKKKVVTTVASRKSVVMLAYRSVLDLKMAKGTRGASARRSAMANAARKTAATIRLAITWPLRHPRLIASSSP